MKTRGRIDAHLANAKQRKCTSHKKKWRREHKTSQNI